MDLPAGLVELQRDWDDLTTGTPPGPAAMALGDLVGRHAEPHRRYHTIDHVAAVVAALTDLGGRTDRTVRWAAWYHDAVYDPTTDGNEAASAAMATSTLPGLGVGGADVDEVARLILLTRDHAVAPDDRSGAVLVDADLSILGAAPEDYDRYVAGVRVEYGHVPDDAWRAGRAAVLRTFLDRPALFRTDEARRWWEAPARANLGRELALLGG